MKQDRGSRRLKAGAKEQLLVIGPDLRQRRAPIEMVRADLCRQFEESASSKADRLLEQAGIPAKRQGQVRAALLREQIGNKRISGCWVLRLSPGANWLRQAHHARLGRRLAGLTCGQAGQYVLWLLSWYMLGQGALRGRLDPGWLIAWALVLLCMTPCRMLATWSAGKIAMGAGALLKRRLLHGVLQLEPEEIRRQGIGQLLGCVIESEAVESLALSSGFLGLAACIELALAGVVLGAGAGGWRHALLLAGWVVFVFGIAWAYWRERKRWTSARLEMTNDLVERMVGHRTRLAHERPEQWHEGEDQLVENYQALSAGMDRKAALLMAVAPRGWLVTGLAGLVPAFVFGVSSPAGLAVSLGGIVLAFRALQKLAAGLWHVAGATIAWERVAPLFHAAARQQPGDSSAWLPANSACARENGRHQALIEAHDIVFRYRPRGEAVLRGCNLSIKSGERLLLEGASGGGKSTLASVLAGLRQAESGLLLLEGLDYRTLGGPNWRRRVAVAPQFHENHVLTGTFAFNLLMGRRWPPQEEDLRQAESLCRELGLEDLLGRMPGGLLQMVGETGWQLSHGEKSRLYIARALLQGADLIVLDESFAALDPETLHRALKCAIDRASTLLVIAHP